MLAALMAAIILVGSVSACSRDNSRATAPSASVEHKCGSWAAQLSTDDTARMAYQSPLWRALAEGRPMDVLIQLQQPPAQDDPHFALWMRSSVEVAETLFQLRETQQLALRILLERLLSARTVPTPTTLQSQPESRHTLNASQLVQSPLVPFLRASLAVQSGEPLPITQWLALLDQNSPLQPAARVLESIQSQPLRGEGLSAAAHRWTTGLPVYLKALEAARSLFNSAGLRRLELLTTAPPRWPIEWYERLQLRSADVEILEHRSHLGQAELAITSQLFDTSLITVLPEVWLETVLSIQTDSPFGKVWQNRARHLKDRGKASTEACTLVPQLKGERVTALPWLVYGDFLDTKALSAQLESRCRGRLPPCSKDSETSDSTRDSMEDEALACYLALEPVSPDVSAQARQEAWLSGPQRRLLLEPILDGTCDARALDILHEWDSIRSAEQPSRWMSLPPLLLKTRLYVRQQTPEQAVGDVRALQQRDPLMSGLYQTLRLLSIPTREGMPGILQ